MQNEAKNNHLIFLSSEQELSSLWRACPPPSVSGNRGQGVLPPPGISRACGRPLQAWHILVPAAPPVSLRTWNSGLSCGVCRGESCWAGHRLPPVLGQGNGDASKTGQAEPGHGVLPSLATVWGITIPLRHLMGHLLMGSHTVFRSQQLNHVPVLPEPSWDSPSLCARASCPCRGEMCPSLALCSQLPSATDSIHRSRAA